MAAVIVPVPVSGPGSGSRVGRWHGDAVAGRWGAEVLFYEFAGGWIAGKV